MSKDDNLLGGFMALLGDDIEDSLQNPAEPVHTDNPDIDDVNPDLDDVDDTEPADDESGKKKTKRETKKETDDDLLEALKALEKVPETKEPEPKEGEEGKDDDGKAAGSDLIATLTKAFYERNGWEFNEDTKLPETVEEFMESIEAIIEYNSTPEFANEELARLNDFVKQGGNLRDYLEQTTIADEYNLESELDQRRAVSDLLKHQGYTSAQINKKINKYEEAGILEDEATEAAETLKTISEKRKLELIENEKRLSQQREQMQREYYDSVVNNIKQMKDVRGVSISDKEKREVLEFLLKPTTNGLTGFTEHLQKSVGNLIELAIFAKYPDKLLDATKKTGAKTALDELKDKLRNNVQHKTTSKVSYGDSKRFWEML